MGSLFLAIINIFVCIRDGSLFKTTKLGHFHRLILLVSNLKSVVNLRNRKPKRTTSWKASSYRGFLFGAHVPWAALVLSLGAVCCSRGGFRLPCHCVYCAPCPPSLPASHLHGLNACRHHPWEVFLPCSLLLSPEMAVFPSLSTDAVLFSSTLHPFRGWLVWPVVLRTCQVLIEFLFLFKIPRWGKWRWQWNVSSSRLFHLQGTETH